MAKSVAERRAAARKKPEAVETHQWYRLMAVTDQMNLVLRRIYEGDKGKMFEYEYTDEFNSFGRPSTKYKLPLVMPESQISDEIGKNIFKIVTDDSSITITETPDTSGDLGKDSSSDKVSGRAEQSSLFS